MQTRERETHTHTDRETERDREREKEREGDSVYGFTCVPPRLRLYYLTLILKDIKILLLTVRVQHPVIRFQDWTG